MCIPNVSYAVVVGNTIDFGVIHAYPPDVFCAQMMTLWSRSETIGPLPDGTYVVEATLYEWTEPVAGPTPVRSFTVGAPEPSVVPLDIRPGACPNSLNRKSCGKLPIALLGTDMFDVSDVDLTTIQLARADGVGVSVAPLEGPPGPHSVIEDVGTPFDGQVCECHDLGSDDIDDLLMRFDTQDLVQELLLDELSGGDEVDLALTGSLLDGTPFEASDCVTLIPKRGSNATRGRKGVSVNAR